MRKSNRAIQNLPPPLVTETRVPNNLVVRFLLAIKHIFLSSIVNVLLVFVLAGVAVRRLTSVYPYYPFQTHDTKPLI